MGATMYDRLMAVSRGCQLVSVGLMITVAAAAFGFAGGFLAGADAGADADPDAPGPDPKAVPTMRAVRLVEGALLVAGHVVGLIGRLRCLAVPKGAGDARPLVAGSAAAEVATVGVALYGIADGAAGPFASTAATLAVGGVGELLSIASLILFLLFVRSTGGYVRRRSLGRRAATALRLAGAAAGCVVPGFGLMIGGAAAGGAAPAGVCGGSLFMLAAVVLLVVVAAKTVPLVNDLGAAAARHAERIEEWVDEYKWDDEDDRPRR